MTTSEWAVQHCRACPDPLDCDRCPLAPLPADTSVESVNPSVGEGLGAMTWMCSDTPPADPSSPGGADPLVVTGAAQAVFTPAVDTPVSTSDTDDGIDLFQKLCDDLARQLDLIAHERDELRGWSGRMRQSEREVARLRQQLGEAAGELEVVAGHRSGFYEDGPLYRCGFHDDECPRLVAGQYTVTTYPDGSTFTTGWATLDGR